MTTFFQSLNGARTMVNGELVEDAMVGTHYNSSTKKLEIDTYNKGQRDHIELDQKDIMKILSQPASAMALEKRLMRDFGLGMTTMKSRKSIKSIKSRKSRKSIKSRKSRK